MLENFELPDEAYDSYSEQLDKLTGTKIIEIKQQLHSKRSLLEYTKRELQERSESIINSDKSDPVYKANRSKIDTLADDQDSLQDEISELEAKITSPDRIKLSKEEFLNVIESAPNKMRAGTSIE